VPSPWSWSSFPGPWPNGSPRRSIPTIGIGAGAGCDGQVLVLPDALGLNPGFTPRFLHRFADLHGAALEGARAYPGGAGGELPRAGAHLRRGGGGGE
jgi:hypothetical protein